MSYKIKIEQLHLYDNKYVLIHDAMEIGSMADNKIAELEERVHRLEDVLEPLIECALLNAGHHTAARTARKVLQAKAKEQSDDS